MKRRISRSIDQPIRDLATHQPREVTVPVLSSYLEVDDRTVTRMIAAGKLHAYKVGREWRISVASLRRAFPVEQHQRAL